MSNYFILYSADGPEVDLDGPLTKEQVTQHIRDWRDDEIPVEFVESFEELQEDYRGDSKPRALVIKGKILLPKPVKVVEEYEIP